jgi:hypothetical protein
LFHRPLRAFSAHDPKKGQESSSHEERLGTSASFGKEKFSEEPMGGFGQLIDGAVKPVSADGVLSSPKPVRWSFPRDWQ